MTSQLAAKNYQQTVDEATRDKVFAELRPLLNNNLCFDCHKKNPKWASIHLGLFLCIDCAGLHRQYGVMNSFVKSTNLDAWNHRQLVYMKKGGNDLATEYFKKVGLISELKTRIDYKSPGVQAYKNALTAKVDSELFGKLVVENAEQKKVETPGFFDIAPKSVEQPIQIVITEEVTMGTQDLEQAGKKKKEKKKLGKQVNLEMFDQMEFDGGISKEQEKAGRNDKFDFDSSPAVNEAIESHPIDQINPIVQTPPPPVELSEAELKQKMEQLKGTNLKAISSDQFKSHAASDAQAKQNLNRFANSSSISSASVFNEGSNQSGQTIEKLKDIVSDASEKIIEKLKDWGWKK